MSPTSSWSLTSSFPSVESDRKRAGRPRLRSLGDHLDFKICILEDRQLNRISFNSTFNKLLYSRFALFMSVQQLWDETRSLPVSLQFGSSRCSSCSVLVVSRSRTSCTCSGPRSLSWQEINLLASLSPTEERSFILWGSRRWRQRRSTGDSASTDVQPSTSSWRSESLFTVYFCLKYGV